MSVFKQPTARHVRGLHQAQHAAEPGFRELLEETLEITKHELVYAQDQRLVPRLQGRAEVIDELLRMMKDSPSMLAKLNQHA